MASKSFTELKQEYDTLIASVKKGSKVGADSIDMLTTAMKLLDEAAKKTKKDLKIIDPKDVKSIQELNALTERANNLNRNKNQINKELIKEKLRLQEANKKRNQELREEIALEQKNLGTIEKLQLRNKKLVQERKKLNLATKEGRFRLKQINTELDRNNKFLEKNSDKLGKQRIGIGRYSKAINGLRGGLAKLGVAFGVFTLIRGSFDVIRNFQQSQADLASVLGVNVEAMGALTDQAKELGATTKFTASEVANLQKELAKLGFTQSQIEDMTESTLQLAAAAGVELAEAATVAGSTLRGFGLNSKDTQRVVDVMAKSFSSSSLDMAKFSTAMASVAPVAKTFGFSIEQTTALLGTLTDSGIEASTAGTGLKNMMLDANKANLTFAEALQKVNESTDKAGTSFDLFGKRGAVLGVVLAENSEAIETLEGKLNDAGGAAQEMADKQLATLDGSLALVKSAWEGQILAMDEAGGVGEKLRLGLEFLANNMTTILKVLGRIVKAFVIFKATMFALKIRDQIRNFKKFGGAISKTGKDLTKAEASAKNFGRTVKGIGWAALIGLALDLANSFIDIATGADVAARELERFNEINAQSTENTNANISAIRTLIDEEKRRIDLLVAGSELTEKAANETLKAFINQKEFIGSFAEEIGGPITDQYNNFFDTVDDLIKQQERTIGLSQGNIKSLQQEAFKNRLNIADEKALIENSKEQIELLQSFKVELENERFQLDLTSKEFEKFGKNKTKIKDINDEYQDQIDLLDQLNETLGDTLGAQQELIQADLASDLSDINAELATELKFIEDLQKVMSADEQVDLTNFLDLINQRTDIQIKAIEEARDFEIQALKDTNAARFETLREQAEKERDAKIKAAKGDATKIKEIEKAFSEDIEEIRLAELDATENLKTKEIAIRTTANTEIKEIERSTAIEIDEFKDELADRDKARKEKELEELEKLEKEKFERQKEFIDLLTEAFEKGADARIKKIDEEIDAAQKQADFFRDLAASGNITAKESLAEQNRLIAEANAQKEAEEKRKQRILLVSSILQAFNANLAAGDNSTEAFTKAITSTTLLTQFIGALPTFLEGTEDTGAQGLGVDGKGGFKAILHPNERVMTKEQNAQIGDYSNSEVAKIMEQHRLGRIADGSQINVGWDNSLLVNQLMDVKGELGNIKKAIEDQPHASMEMVRSFRSYLIMQETIKEKGKITRTDIKVNR